MANGSIWGITTLFGGGSSPVRLRNFRTFRSRLREQGLPLLAVELAYGDEAHRLGPDDAEIRVRLRSGEVLFHKEALLNAALSRLPPECEAVLWLDADVIFERPDWVRASRRALEAHPVIQPYSRHVGPARGFRSAFPVGSRAGSRTVQESFAARRAGSAGAPLDEFHQGRLGHPGLAWGARREVLEEIRFFDLAVLGGGDLLMAYGMCSPAPVLRTWPPGLLRVFRGWAERAFAVVGSDLGVVEGTVRDLWHGPIRNRFYGSSYRLFLPWDFDPRRELRREESGLPAFSGPRADRLRARARTYFRIREGEAPEHSVLAWHARDVLQQAKTRLGKWLATGR